MASWIRLRHPDGREVAGAQEPGEAQRVAVVVLDVARRRRDLRWRDDDAGQACRPEFAVERVGARSGLVGALDRAVLLFELAQQRDHGGRLVRHIADEPHLPIATWLGHGDGHRGLVHIHTNEQRSVVHVEPRRCGRPVSARPLPAPVGAIGGHIIWRGGRAGARTSSERPGCVAGDRGGGLGDGAARDRREEAERPSGRQAGSFTRSGKEDGPAIPGHGKGRFYSSVPSTFTSENPCCACNERRPWISSRHELDMGGWPCHRSSGAGAATLGRCAVALPPR